MWAGLGAGLRRVHAAVLLAFTVVLLLWLSHLPPLPAAPPPAPLYVHFNHSQTSPAPVVQNLTAAPPKPSQSVSVSASVASSSKRASNVVLTREVYVAGHSRPHSELCPALGAHLKLLVLITSAPSHQDARAAIRLTWGHYAQRSDIAMAFVLGTPPTSMQKMVETEDKLYGDLIVGNFMDSYSNLTLKTLSMLEWADTYCSRAPRLLKTDDDMFINIEKLLQFAYAPARRNATKTIWGKVVHKSLPKRTTKSKYYVPPAQFPGRVFPDFATGPAYLVTGDCIMKLREVALNEPFLRLEDVFVTGVLATKLGIKRINAKEFYNKKVQPHPCTVQRGIALHMVRYHEQFDLWRKLLDRRSNCDAG